MHGQPKCKPGERSSVGKLHPEGGGKRGMREVGPHMQPDKHHGKRHRNSEAQSARKNNRRRGPRDRVLREPGDELVSPHRPGSRSIEESTRSARWTATLTADSDIPERIAASCV